MLEKIREGSQGITAKVILGLVILTFALAGLGSYTNSVDTSVAEVNGLKISKNEFDKAYQAQRNRMAQQYGEMFDTLAADSTYMANFRNSVLDNLINEKLIDQNNANLAIRVSDERLKKTIREMPEFQVDGVFDNNRYLAVINQAGFFQSSDFRDYLRVEMTRRQLSQALVASEFSLPYQEEQTTSLQNQKRDIRFATINAEQFKSLVEVTEQEINNYYLENQTRFEIQEKVKVDYLSLDVNELAKGISVSDADVKAYYEENLENYRQAEQRRFSHILVEFGDNEVAAEAQAQAILARINSGEDFAEVAKTDSADTFSGENGGDLDWMERGTMDEAFDESAFALAEVNQVSDLVKTDFGFHIIKMTDLKAAQLKTLAELQDELKAKISNEKAQDEFFALQQEMARVSFEFPDSLDDAALAINGVTQTSTWLSRSTNVAPFDNAKVLDAAFSDLVLTEQVNSDVIEVNESLAMVIRLNEYQAAQVKPLTEVEAEIKTLLIAKKATEKAQVTADEILVQFKAGSDITESLSAVNATFENKADIARFGGQIDANLSREAFSLAHPEDGAISAATIKLSNGDLAILEVQAVKAGDTMVNPALAKQQTSLLAQSAYQSYVDTLKVGAKISRSALTEATQQY